MSDELAATGRQAGSRPWQRDRARGCCLGQLCGDALGSLVEFRSSESIREQYPDGVRDMADGGAFNTLAGQPTDDSEMALTLARSLVRLGRFDPDLVRESYREWYESGPFDCGNTIGNALCGRHNADSQANGALMRISPLGIFGVGKDLNDVASWAMEDAALTHPNPVCQQVNALFAMAIAVSIRDGLNNEAVYEFILRSAAEMNVEEGVADALAASDQEPWIDRMSSSMGWVLVAFQNALFQLRHASDVEAAIVDTVGRGGDSDTNAAICGALLGSVYGVAELPERWVSTVLNCRPSASEPRAMQKRPEKYWPVDALELADQLLAA